MGGLLRSRTILLQSGTIIRKWPLIPVLILNTTRFLILLTEVFKGGLSAIVLCFLMMHSKYYRVSDIEHDSSGKSNSSFYVGEDIFSLLFLSRFYDLPRIINA